MTRMQQVAENAAVYGIWTGIVLILLTPFVVTPDTIFPFVVGKAVYSRSLIECVFGIWAILALFRPAYRPPRSWLLLLLAVNVGVSVLAACFGVSPQRSFWSTYERMQGVVDLIHWFAFAVVLASVLRTERDWRIVLNLNMGAGLIMIVLAICLYCFEDTLFSTYDPDKRFVDESERFGVGARGRISATFGNPLYLAAYLMMNCLLAAGFLVLSLISTVPSSVDSLLQKESERKGPFLKSDEKHVPLRLWMQRCFWGTVVTLGLWALSLTGARGAFLGFLAGIGVLGALLISQSRSWIISLTHVKRLGILVCAAGLIVFVTFESREQFTVGISNSLLNRLLSYESEQESIRARLEAWKVGLRGFIERPLLGWGPENYIVIFGSYASADMHETGINDSSHNKFIEESVAKGIFGQVIYFTLWGQFLFIIVNAATTLGARNSVLPFCVGITIVGHFVESQFSVQNFITSFQYFLFFGFAIRLETDGKKPLSIDRRKFFFSYKRICAVGTASILLVVGTCLLANRAIYLAASNLKMATSLSNLPGESVVYIERATVQFEPLANSSRTILFNNAPAFWKILRRRHKNEAKRFLTFVEAEADKFLVSDPENWNLYRDMARLYIATLNYHPEYRHKMMFYSKRALELAPHCAIPLFLFRSGGNGSLRSNSETVQDSGTEG